MARLPTSQLLDDALLGSWLVRGRSLSACYLTALPLPDAAGFTDSMSLSREIANPTRAEDYQRTSQRNESRETGFLRSCQGASNCEGLTLQGALTINAKPDMWSGLLPLK